MNEKWNVLTYRDYDFKDQSGRQVKGRTLHCYRKNSGDGWPGVEYAKFSVQYGTDPYNVAPVVGAMYELSFNRYGKVVAMKPAA